MTSEKILRFFSFILFNMTSTTNFFRQINKLKIQIQTKISIFQNIVIFSLFSLFLGFVMGNLFGTFLNTFRNLLNWDGLIISMTILIIEFINYLNYKKKAVNLILKKNSNTLVNERPFETLFTLVNKKMKTKLNFIKFLNFYKIGLLLGFFIDAFKVGS